MTETGPPILGSVYHRAASEIARLPRGTKVCYAPKDRRSRRIAEAGSRIGRIKSVSRDWKGVVRVYVEFPGFTPDVSYGSPVTHFGAWVDSKHVEGA